MNIFSKSSRTTKNTAVAPHNAETTIQNVFTYPYLMVTGTLRSIVPGG